MKTVILIFLIFIPGFSIGQPEEEGAVIKTIERFFEGLNNKDTTKLNSVIHDKGVMISTRETEDFRISQLEQFPENLLAGPDQYVERMWDPEVLINRNLAVVWAPYDFHINNDFSHCGTDAFSLIKTSDEWRIVSIVYNVVTKDCDSPLKPLDDNH